MKNNETLLLIKPDVIEKCQVGEIITMLEKHFTLCNIRSLRLSIEVAKEFYSEHKTKSFYAELVSFITSGFIIAIVLSGDENVVLKVREIVGLTDFRKAGKTTIRGRFGSSLIRNAVHASDSFDAYVREFNLLFKTYHD